MSTVTFSSGTSVQNPSGFLVSSSHLAYVPPHYSITFCGALSITHDGRMIILEGLSKEEATQEAAKALIVSFEEQIQKMVDARVTAAAHALLWSEKAEDDTLRLDWLLNHQVSTQHYGCNSYCRMHASRDAIDAAMKEASK